MSILVKDPSKLYNVCNQQSKNCSCCPFSRPVCCYPLPPPCDPCFCCKIPPCCPPPPPPPPPSLCPPGKPPHSGPLPNRACYECPSPLSCPPTNAGLLMTFIKQ